MSGLIGLRVRYRHAPGGDTQYAEKVGTIFSVGMDNDGRFYGLALFDDCRFKSIYLEDADLVPISEWKRGDAP